MNIKEYSRSDFETMEIKVKSYEGSAVFDSGEKLKISNPLSATFGPIPSGIFSESSPVMPTRLDSPIEYLPNDYLVNFKKFQSGSSNCPQNIKRSVQASWIEFNEMAKKTRIWDGGQLELNLTNFTLIVNSITQLSDKKELGEYEIKISERLADWDIRISSFEDDLNMNKEVTNIEPPDSDLLKVMQIVDDLYWAKGALAQKFLMRKTESKSHKSRRLHVEYIGGTSYCIVRNSNNRIVFQLLYNRHFSMISSGGRTLLSQGVVLNYMITCLEQRLILSTLSNTGEYKWMKPIISNINDFLFSCKSLSYESKSGAMKSLETYCLTLSDLVGSGMKVNSLGFIDTMNDIKNYLGLTFSTVELALAISGKVHIRHPFIEALKQIANLPPELIIEISCIHKYCGICPGSLRAGLEKFVNRTNSRFSISQDATRTNLRILRSLLYIGYKSKHSSRPPVTNIEKCLELFTEMDMEISKPSSRVLNSLLKDVRWDDVNYDTWFYGDFPSRASDYIKNKACSADDVRFGNHRNTIPGFEYLLSKGDSEAIPITELVAEMEDCARSPTEAFNLMKSHIDWIIDDQSDQTHLINKSPYTEVVFFKKTERLTIFSRDPPLINKLMRCCYNKKPSFGYPYCAINAKEKEQKFEFRFYGMATYQLKCSISRYSEMVKRVMKYIPGQVMTPSFRKRLLKLHETAQDLSHEDSFSFMMDISGHNQSMTEGNTHLISKECLSLFGEIESVPVHRIYKYMMIFEEETFEDLSFLSFGQKQGIEGWFGPTWGLTTTLDTIRIMISSSQEIDKISVYSDDIQLNARLINQSDCENFLIQARKMYADNGFDLKITQTAYSKSRVTMLRNHFTNGNLISPSLKRMMALSRFNSKLFKSTELEVISIDSESSSSMEFTERVYSVTFMKWYFAVTAINADFAGDFFYYLRQENNYSDLLLSGNTLNQIRQSEILMKSSIQQRIVYSDKQIDMPMKIGESFYWVHIGKDENDTFARCDDRIITYTDDPTLFLSICMKVSLETSPRFKASKIAWMARAEGIESHKLTRVELSVAALLLSPRSVGGYGLSSCAYSGVSGHSDSSVKKISAVSLLLSHHSSSFPDLCKMLKNGILSKWIPRTRTLLDLHRCDSFPQSSSFESTTDILSSIVKDRIQRSTNSSSRSLILMGEARKKLMTKMLSTSSGGACLRFLRFMYDNLPGAQIDLYLSKVERDQKVLLSVKNKIPIIERITRSNRSRMKYLTTRHDLGCQDMVDDISMSYHTPIESILKIFRDLQYSQSGVIVLDTVEPTYLGCVNECVSSDIIVDLVDRYTIKDGINYLRAPAFAESIKPHFDPRLGLEANFRNRDEYRVFCIVRLSKWLINSNQEVKKMNYSSIEACADIALSAHNCTNYSDLSCIIVSTTSGRGMHRINDRGFKSGTSVRCFTQSSGSVSVTMTNSFYHKVGGEDSNVNLSLLRHQLIFSRLLSKKYSRNHRARLRVFSLSETLPVSFQDADIPLAFDTMSIDRHKHGESMDSRFFETSYRLSNMMIGGMDFDDVTNMIGARSSHKSLNLSGESATRFKILCRFREHVRDSNYFSVSEMPDSVVVDIFSDVEFWEVGDRASIQNKRSYLMQLTSSGRRLVCYDADVHGAISELADDKSRKQRQSFSDLFSRDNNISVVLKKFVEFTAVLAATMVMKNCLVYQVTSSKDHSCLLVNVNKEKTVSLMKKCKHDLRVGHWPMKDPDDNRLLDVLDLTSVNLIDKTFKTIDSWLDESTLSLIDLPRGLWEKEEYLIMVDPSKVVDRKCIYSIINVTSTELNRTNEYRPLFKLLMDTVDLYSPLDSLDSPTGSGALQGAFGVLRLMKSEELLKGKRILDITAGRGDWELAMNNMNIDHESWSRGDQWDRMHYSRNVKYDKKINIYNTSTWVSKLLPKDIVIMDISYSKSKGKSNVFESIDEFIDCCSGCVLRVNWLTDGVPDKLISKWRSSNKQIFWMSPDQGRSLSRNMYLFIGGRYLDSSKNIQVIDSPIETSPMVSHMKKICGSLSSSTWDHLSSSSDIIIPETMRIDEALIERKSRMLSTADSSELKSYSTYSVSFSITRSVSNLLDSKYKTYEDINRDVFNMTIGSGIKYREHYVEVMKKTCNKSALYEMKGTDPPSIDLFSKKISLSKKLAYLKSKILDGGFENLDPGKSPTEYQSTTVFSDPSMKSQQNYLAFLESSMFNKSQSKNMNRMLRSLSQLMRWGLMFDDDGNFKDLSNTVINLGKLYTHGSADSEINIDRENICQTLAIISRVRTNSSMAGYLYIYKHLGGDRSTRKRLLSLLMTYRRYAYVIDNLIKEKEHRWHLFNIIRGVEFPSIDELLVTVSSDRERNCSISDKMSSVITPVNGDPEFEKAIDALGAQIMSLMSNRDKPFMEKSSLSQTQMDEVEGSYGNIFSMRSDTFLSAFQCGLDSIMPEDDYEEDDNYFLD